MFEIEQVVAQIDNYVPVFGKLLDHFLTDSSGRRIVALEAQVPFFLSHDMRFLLHFRGRATQPLRRQSHLMRFDGGIHPPRHDQTVIGLQFITLAIRGVSLRELFVRRVQISERKIGHIQSWIGSRQLLEIFLGVLIVSGFSGNVTQRSEGEPVHGVNREYLFINGDRFFGTTQFYQEISVELQTVWILGVDRQCIFDVVSCAIEITGV